MIDVEVLAGGIDAVTVDYGLPHPNIKANFERFATGSKVHAKIRVTLVEEDLPKRVQAVEFETAADVSSDSWVHDVIMSFRDWAEALVGREESSQT